MKNHLHKKQHHSPHAGPLPHLADAAHPETGKVDMEKLKAGQAAWQGAIDDTHDALLVTRRKLK